MSAVEAVVQAPARRARVAFLGQEDIAVPPPIPGASVQRVVHELALELRDRFDIMIVSPPHPSFRDGVHDGIRYSYVHSGRDAAVTRLARESVRVLRRLDVPYRPPYGLPFYATGYARAGLKRIAEFDPDIVHLQMASQFLPIARKAAPRAKLVLHMHSDWLIELPRDVVRKRLRDADLILGVSEYITDGVRRAFPELADRCECLYNGVVPERFPDRQALDGELRELADREFERLALAGAKVVLFVGSRAPESKGFEVLLEAFPRLRERVPEAKLLVASPGIIRYAGVTSPTTRAERRRQRERFRDYPALLERLAVPLGDRIAMAGGVPNDRLPAYYALADVVAIPSIWNEPFTLVALEAAACGVPIVASRRGGLPESVVDGVTGKLVPHADPAALADALAEVLQDTALAFHLGAEARARIERSFAWRRQADHLAELYAELLAQGNDRNGG